MTILACNKLSSDNNTENNQPQKEALTALRTAGVNTDGVNIIYDGIICGPSWNEQNQIKGYYQVCGQKDDNIYLYILSFDSDKTADENIVVSLSNDIVKNNFKYIATYSVPLPETQQLTIEHGYGLPADQIPYSWTRMVNFIENGPIRYGVIVDFYGEGTANPTIKNPRLIADNSGSIKIVNHTIITSEDQNYLSDSPSYNYSMAKGYNNSVICGFYCYSSTGERLFEVSAWSDLYRFHKSVSLGWWEFPLSKNRYLLINFDCTDQSKASPVPCNVRIIVDNIETGDSEYQTNISLGNGIFEHSIFKSSDNGVYSFSIDAIVYSGDKHTYELSFDTKTNVMTVDGNSTQQDPTPLFSLDSLYGTWQISKAKYTEQAKMTDWDHESTSITFKENGSFEGSGYFGNGSGTYTVNGNTIETFIGGSPFISYEVSAYNKEENIIQCTAFIASSNQTIWMECSKILNTSPIVVIGDDTIFGNEATVQAAMSGLFAKLRDFEIRREYLEYLIIKNDRTDLSPLSSNISNVWKAGYNAINIANQIIKGLVNSSLSENFKFENLAQTRAIRSFIYYNMAVLWGDLPYITESTNENDLMNGVSRSSVNSILENEIQAFDLYRENVSSKDYYFTRTSNHMLNNEMAMYLKDLTKMVQFEKTGNPSMSDIMWSVLIYNPGIESNQYSKYCKEIFGDEYQQVAPVYYNKHVDLYYEEINANLGNSSELKTLLSHWGTADTFIYGRWAMLKRIGQAQAQVGCKDYQLLLPIPQSEVNSNPKINQNPGY